MSETPIRDCEMGVDDPYLKVGSRAAACFYTADYDLSDCQNNGKRLAACWNALRGIPTEELGTLWELVCNALHIASLAPVEQYTVGDRENLVRLLRLYELWKAAT